MIKKEDVYCIGRIGKPHGVNGEVTFQFDDDVFDRVDADYLFIEIDGLLVPFFMDEYRFRSDDVALMTFEGIDTEEKAEELTGCSVWFPRSLADDEEKENVSKAEIIGYSVIDASNSKNVGTITSVDDSTTNLLFQLSTEKGEILLPASPELIKGIDKKARTVTMEIAEGLLEL